MTAPGRIFLKDGYSAGVMRLIYDQPVRAPLLDRVFYGYPLHRAVRTFEPLESPQHLEIQGFNVFSASSRRKRDSKCCL